MSRPSMIVTDGWLGSLVASTASTWPEKEDAAVSTSAPSAPGAIVTGDAVTLAGSEPVGPTGFTSHPSDDPFLTVR